MFFFAQKHHHDLTPPPFKETKILTHFRRLKRRQGVRCLKGKKERKTHEEISFLFLKKKRVLRNPKKEEMPDNGFANEKLFRPGNFSSFFSSFSYFFVKEILTIVAKKHHKKSSRPDNIAVFFIRDSHF